MKIAGRPDMTNDGFICISSATTERADVMRAFVRGA
jgi:hypothetical protein